MNTTNTHSASALPITRHEGKWRLGKPIHSHRVVTMHGVFPLSMHIETELPTYRTTSVMAVELDIMDEQLKIDIMPHEHSVVKLTSEDNDRIFQSTMRLEATTRNSVQGGDVESEGE